MGLVNLKTFLALLRAEDIPVGPGELLRLQQAFNLEPLLDRQGLKQLLACTLVKNEQQRETFEWLFEQWCPDNEACPERPPPQPEPKPVEPAAEPVVPSPQPPPVTPSDRPPATPQPPERHLPLETRWFLAVIAMVAVIFAGWLLYAYLNPPVVVVPPPLKPSVSPPPEPTQDTHELPTEPVQTFHTWMPEIGSIQAPLAENTWLPGILGIATGIFLFQRYRRRSRLPDPVPRPRSDPDWLPWLARESSGLELLNPDELRTLIWGIGRFVSEELTQQVDIDRTVAATASAGGIPEIRYQPAVYQREVWLWQDALTQDPLLERLALELTSSLRRAGLPVRRGWFTEVPEQIIWEEGQIFSTLVLEGHRQSALVAVLTDGRGLRLAMQSDLERRPLTRLLNALSQWPQLTFVDFSRGQHTLAKRLHPYGIGCIAPEALPAFLGVREVVAKTSWQADERLLGDLRVWAAATTLVPGPVDDAEAFDLRRALDLASSPWTFQDLLRNGDDLGGRLAWPPQRRAELLNWLVQAERQETSVSHGTCLDKALNFWQQRLQQERSRREQRQRELQELWLGTLAEQRLLLEEAMLALWREPEGATKELYKRHGEPGKEGPLREEIRTRLSKLATAEWRSFGSEHPEVVFLPWRESDQTDATRYMLGAMGFGSALKQEQQPGKLHRPGTLVLIAGLCGGLGILALGLSMWNWLRPAEPVWRPTTTVFVHEVFKGLTIQDSVLSGLNQYTLAIGTPRYLVQLVKVPGGSEIPVTWRWLAQPNPLPLGHSELWRAGTLPQVIRGCEPDWPRRSLVVIAADPADKAVRQLTIQLLNRGSADAVLVGKDWQEHYRKELIQVDALFTRQEQLLVIVPPGSSLPAKPMDFEGRYTAIAAKDFAALAKALDFAGFKPLPEVWQTYLDKVPDSAQSIVLRGGPAEKEDSDSEVKFVQVCGGTFTMGSGAEDEDAYQDEKPSHQVALSPFEISQYETTNAQYRRFKQDHPFNDDSPVVNVIWEDAKAFCEHYGYSLPTEAQWEYAARAGTTTHWSSGNAEQQLGQYAWFLGNSGNRVQPVGGKLPNPLGLYDMHGNAWEWVTDCYDGGAYTHRKELTVDPLETGGRCLLRVLRGGAFWREARILRSADRYRVVPGFWVDDRGFRCVRGPRRRP